MGQAAPMAAAAGDEAQCDSLQRRALLGVNQEGWVESGCGDGETHGGRGRWEKHSALLWGSAAPYNLGFAPSPKEGANGERGSRVPAGAGTVPSARGRGGARRSRAGVGAPPSPYFIDSQRCHFFL